MTIASYYFVPLKSVSPFVIQIDEKTGVTEVVDSKNADEFTQNELLVKFFANKYILAREEYNYLTSDENRQIVRLMSAPDVYREYITYENDPNGPVNTFAPILTENSPSAPHRYDLTKPTAKSPLTPACM